MCRKVEGAACETHGAESVNEDQTNNPGSKVMKKNLVLNSAEHEILSHI